MSANVRPYDLRVDHLIAPLGIGGRSPLLSWKLPAKNSSQISYRILAGDWDSGVINSSQSLYVPVGIHPLSRMTVKWKVKTWSDLGESEWSEPSSWEHGLLNEDDWSALWISPVESADLPGRQRPAYCLTGKFNVKGEVAKARIYATSHGIYEAFLNGIRIGDCELTPGWTAYHANLQVQTYDVTDHIRIGDNVVGALLSDGWWRGQNCVSRRVNDYGATTALLMQLEVAMKSGETFTFGTGENWQSSKSHVTGADLIAGEIHDLRERIDWFDRDNCDSVLIEDYGYSKLCSSPSPPVRQIDELHPVSISKVDQDKWVVDFGQNINGWLRLAQLGTKGNKIVLTYGEWLDKKGDVTQENVKHYNPMGETPVVSFQEDIVISAGNSADIFEPRHSTKGFQFVRIVGYEGELTSENITAVVVHTDMERIGSFICSSIDINAIHEIAEWSFRGNACDIPTDCPTRERAGWTGDWQMYIETASFLYDAYGFTSKWLRDLAVEQRPDGKVTNLVPESHPGDSRPPFFWPLIEGSAGWGDASVHVPWIAFMTTGDSQVLRDQWPSMKAWVDYSANVAATTRHWSRIDRSNEPLSHEKFIWDTGWHFGEWLEAGESLEDAIALASNSDPGPVATAYLFRSAMELAETAELLDKQSDANYYFKLALDVADAWRKEFLLDDGVATPDTQANYARAISFGLIPDHLREASSSRLVELIRAENNHVTTGFLSAPLLLPVLADCGHSDVAYDLLLQDTEPSWLAMVRKGATTVWEEWGGVDSDGVAHASLNHYGKGAVITFLHQYVAGLKLIEPGYRRFRVKPFLGGGLTWAKATHNCPYGLIEISWEIKDNQFDVALSVPPGTTAELIMPSGRSFDLLSGQHNLSD